MKSEVISFFYDFNCIADKCSDNCCRSWNLTVDEETVSKYKAEPGEEGRKLRHSIKKTSDGGYCLRAPFGKCIHQDKCGLLSIRISAGSANFSQAETVSTFQKCADFSPDIPFPTADMKWALSTLPVRRLQNSF
jgi:lysine-N-methylase